MLRTLLVSFVLLCRIQAQGVSFPLESVSVEGTIMSKEVVMELAGLQVGSPIDKAAIEMASQKLSDTGMFQSVNYRYAPGPRHGYALALTLSDPTNLYNATVDIPGVGDEELWRWLSSQYPLLDHKVPANDAAQGFVARKLEEHLGATLEGHHLVGQLETELIPGGKSTISFQPDPLPRIATVSFTGPSELTPEQLVGLMPKDVMNQGYTDRSFRKAVELNLRRAYEEHGMYHVRFPTISARLESGWAVSVTTSIEEGPKFRLGDVQIIGDELPVDAMLKAANFRKGEIANWTDIQNSTWEAEKPVRRLGYLDAAAKPERILDDEKHVLEVRISVNRGRLYRFGELQIVGLTPSLEAQARKIWKLNAGDPFDYDYPKNFFQAFFRIVDARQFKKFSVSMQKGSAEGVMDFKLVFEPR